MKVLTKKIAFLTSLLLSSYMTFCQIAVYDSVTLGPGYANMSFYSMANGEHANVNAMNWDIQIATTQRSASLRTNDGAGVALYVLQNSDTTSWNAPDTSGMWQLYNSDTSWEIGAFNVLGDNIFNYGWGTYDQFTNNVIGNKFFIIKTISGIFKKIWIKGLIFNSSIFPPTQFYIIKYADLNNSNEVTDTIYKTDFPNKSFIYYSLESNSILDTEPSSTDWDLVFRRYLTLVAPGTYYPVMGVLSHPDVITAEARGVDVVTATDAGSTYVTDISNIGSDWKDFNMTTFMWELEDSLAYFVASQDLNIYRIVFTDFEGSSTGKAHFNITQQVPITAIEETQNIKALAVYPNPVMEKADILFTLKEDADITLSVYNIQGKILSNDNYSGKFGINKVEIPVNNLSNGYYFVSINDGSSRLNYKFIKSE